MMNSQKKLKTTLSYSALASLVLLGTVLSSCGQKPGEGQNPFGGKKDKVEVKAPPSPFAAIANGKADVEGGVITVASRRVGIVSEVFVKEGDIVKKGDILARLEVDDTVLAVNSARAQVKQAESAMIQTRVSLETAQREYKRLETLAPENYIAQQRLDAAKDQISIAQAQLGAQEAAVETARARLAETQFNVEQTAIRAPTDGKIIRRFANPGAGASTLNVTSMFTIEPNTQRIVRAEISESSIPFVAIDQEVELIPEADSKKIFIGRVMRVAPLFGARKLNSDEGNEAADERVVEVVISADGTPFLIGQRVLVKFMKPGEKAGIVREVPKSPTDAKKPD